MHTVLKKMLLALLLAGAATGSVHAANILNQAGNKALLLPVPGENNYITEADLVTLSNPATAPGTAQAAPAAVSPIPEPPVYIMLLIGVGLVSLVARRPAAPPKFSSEA